LTGDRFSSLLFFSLFQYCEEKVDGSDKLKRGFELKNKDNFSFFDFERIE